MKRMLSKIFGILLVGAIGTFCTTGTTLAGKQNTETSNVTSILFKNSKGEEIKTFTGEPLYAEYIGEFLPDEQKFLILALYEDERLADVSFKEFYESELIDEGVELSNTMFPDALNPETPEKYKIKAFAFGENFNPLGISKDLTADNLHVFEYTQNAMPGNAVGIHGSGFGSGSVVILESIETSGKTIECNRKLDVLTISDTYIGMQMPDQLEEGIYNIRVKNGVFKSELIRINLPDGWQVMDTAGTEISPGYQFAIYGNNLDFEDATPKVKFKDVETGTEYQAIAADNDDKLKLILTAPEDIVSGKTYDIYLNNGYGNEYQKGPQVTCITDGDDLFGLGVPWCKTYDDLSSNVINARSKPYGAVGDGKTNDLQAIQKAIDYVASKGGGVVYLPEGIYNLGGNALYFKDNVVLKGDGAAKTVITTIEEPENKSVMIRFNGNHVGITDINVISPENGFEHILHTNRRKYLFIKNCKFENKREQNACAVKIDLSQNILIRDNEFYNYGKQNANRLISLDNNTDLWLTSNKMEWRTSRIMICQAKRVQADNNEMWRWTDADFDYFDNVLGKYANAGFFSLSGGSDLIIENNRAGKKGEGLLEERADGEFVLYEGSQEHYINVGQVTSADSMSLIDTNFDFEENWMTDKEFDVTITAGTGVGQTRRITAYEKNKITIDKKWEVIPDETSCYTVWKTADERVMVRNNTLNEISNGILFYQAGIRKVIISGNTFNNSPNIWLRVAQKDGQLNPIRNVLIEDNVMRNTKNYYPAQIIVHAPYIVGERIYGTGFFNIVVRKNTIQAYNGPDENHPGTPWRKSRPGEGYFCHVSPEIRLTDNETPTQRGVIFDSNTAINCKHAFYLNTGAYQTMILNSTTENIGQLVWDDDLTEPGYGGTHPSVDTVISP